MHAHAHTHPHPHTHMEACNRVGNKKTPGLKGIPNEGQLDKLPHPTNGHMAKMEIWRRQLLSDTNALRARMLQGILTQYKSEVRMAYAITIHKSQGLSLDSALLDIGTSIFSRRLAYVALSRVKTLDGVHLINLDPTQIKAQDSATVEYNRLRSLFARTWLI
ncbi:ATP-dependent DNA helicase PIF1 [Eumeta japonica]|uniref:ATP-dependent DNA helicase PIF1 n=1 Tax=Eumeta variegata TaxID=151549 RepID=A0A4C1YA99_EUMVA|nr:ATP-dependent DNA helicase PIF1 [Eumeta japonica]